MSLKKILAQLALASSVAAIQAVLDNNSARLELNGKSEAPRPARKPKVVKRKVNTPSPTR